MRVLRGLIRRRSVAGRRRGKGRGDVLHRSAAESRGLPEPALAADRVRGLLAALPASARRKRHRRDQRARHFRLPDRGVEHRDDDQSRARCAHADPASGSPRVGALGAVHGRDSRKNRRHLGLRRHRPRDRAAGQGHGHDASTCSRAPAEVARGLDLRSKAPAIPMARCPIATSPRRRRNPSCADSTSSSSRCRSPRKTEGLLGEPELRALPKGAFVLNPARGPLVQQAALLAVLRDGHLGGAALDTHYQYPLPAEASAVGFPARHPHAAHFRHHLLAALQRGPAEHLPPERAPLRRRRAAAQCHPARRPAMILTENHPRPHRPLHRPAEGHLHEVPRAPLRGVHRHRDRHRTHRPRRNLCRLLRSRAGAGHRRVLRADS